MTARIPTKYNINPSCTTTNTAKVHEERPEPNSLPNCACPKTPLLPGKEVRMQVNLSYRELSIRRSKREPLRRIPQPQSQSVHQRSHVSGIKLPALAIFDPKLEQPRCLQAILAFQQIFGHFWNVIAAINAALRRVFLVSPKGKTMEKV
jgi:hypothetical protein